MPPLPLPGDTIGLADAAINAANQEAVISVLETLNGVLGVVANVIQVATFVIPAIEGAPSLSDVMDVLSGIQQGVADIYTDVQGITTEIKMLNITDILQTALDNFNTLLKEPPPQFGKPGPSDVDEPLFFSNAQLAAYMFATNEFTPAQSYWIRPYLAD
jgi:hypothetical protein